MTGIIIKSGERKRAEAQMVRLFGGDIHDASHREYAECAAARTREVVRELKKKEGERL
ncbi:hypothetical protein [Cloacibacillus evryensis]|uniref:hypothetical protein n=1 Tax=Cloacibacillus evryensis TaxID=508460 RepID=UPI00241FA7C1|nr:hypothetical protein [Cloacibacillus evryensis]